MMTNLDKKCGNQDCQIWLAGEFAQFGTGGVLRGAERGRMHLDAASLEGQCAVESYGTEEGPSARRDPRRRGRAVAVGAVVACTALLAAALTLEGRRGSGGGVGQRGSELLEGMTGLQPLPDICSDKANCWSNSGQLPVGPWGMHVLKKGQSPHSWKESTTRARAMINLLSKQAEERKNLNRELELHELGGSSGEVVGGVGKEEQADQEPNVQAEVVHDADAAVEEVNEESAPQETQDEKEAVAPEELPEQEEEEEEEEEQQQQQQPEEGEEEVGAQPEVTEEEAGAEATEEVAPQETQEENQAAAPEGQKQDVQNNVFYQPPSQAYVEGAATPLAGPHFKMHTGLGLMLPGEVVEAHSGLVEGPVQYGVQPQQQQQQEEVQEPAQDVNYGTSPMLPQTRVIYGGPQILGESMAPVQQDVMPMGGQTTLYQSGVAPTVAAAPQSFMPSFLQQQQPQQQPQQQVIMAPQGVYGGLPNSLQRGGGLVQSMVAPSQSVVAGPSMPVAVNGVMQFNPAAAMMRQRSVVPQPQPQPHQVVSYSMEPMQVGHASVSYSPAKPVPSNGVDYGDLPPALVKAIQAGQEGGGASTAGSGVVLPPGVVAAIDKSNQEALQRVKETNDPPGPMEGAQQDAPVEGDDSADAASPSEAAAATTTTATTTTQTSGAGASDAEGDDADAGAGAGAGAVDNEDYGGIPPALVKALEDGSSQGDADQGVPEQGEGDAEKQGVPQQLALLQALRQGRTVAGGSGAMGGSFDVAGGSMSPVSTAVGEGVGVPVEGGGAVGEGTASRPLVEMSFVPQSL